MAKTSINVKPCAISKSEVHNTREQVPDYVQKLREINPNYISEKDTHPEFFSDKTVAQAKEEIAKICKEVGGRKLQKDCNPIREAVVVIKPETTLDDLKRLGNDLNAQYGVNLFQAYIHRDEGHFDKEGIFKCNLHAHMVFDWQNKKTGKILRLTPVDMRNWQTITANALGMERGEIYSKAERLEHGEYREEMERLDREQVQRIAEYERRRIVKEKEVANYEAELEEEKKKSKKNLDELRKKLEEKKKRLSEATGEWQELPNHPPIIQPNKQRTIKGYYTKYTRDEKGIECRTLRLLEQSPDNEFPEHFVPATNDEEFRRAMFILATKTNTKKYYDNKYPFNPSARDFTEEIYEDAKKQYEELIKSYKEQGMEAPKLNYEVDTIYHSPDDKKRTIWG